MESKKGKILPGSRTETLSYNPFKSVKIDKDRLPRSGKVQAKTGVKNPGGKSDEEVFREAMADVREIKEFREIPARKASGKTPPRPKEDDAVLVLKEIVSGKARIRLSDTGEYIEWAGPGIQGDVLERLHGGEFAVQDSVDLHGLTLIEAEAAFFAFFGESLRKGLFCIKVIHGRGLRSPNGPVLKEAATKWLSGPLRKSVRAFTSARDCDGGLGATYIILKYPRPR